MDNEGIQENYGKCEVYFEALFFNQTNTLAKGKGYAAIQCHHNHLWRMFSLNSLHPII
jgi:hypothetical protein